MVWLAVMQLLCNVNRNFVAVPIFCLAMCVELTRTVKRGGEEEGKGLGPGPRTRGGSFIVKVPGDVPPARVYFFGLLV